MLQPYICEVCGFRAFSKSVFMHHERLDHAKKYELKLDKFQREALLEILHERCESCEDPSAPCPLRDVFRQLGEACPQSWLEEDFDDLEGVDELASEEEMRCPKCGGRLIWK